MLKKGELTSGEIIGIVLLLAGVIILLLFLPTFIKIFKGTDSRELCQLSVIARATTPSAAQGAVPLRCTTEKICISEDGGEDCSQFAGEEVFDSISLEDEKEDLAKADLIEQTIANSMLNCWKVMGEGKLDLFGDLGNLPVGIKPEEDPVCVVCSRIAIDRALVADSGFDERVLRYVDVDDYLYTQRPTNSTGLTYIELLSEPGVGRPSKDIVDQVRADGEKPTDQVAVIFSQIKVPESAWAQGFKTATGNFVLIAGGTSIISSFPGINAVVNALSLKVKLVLGAAALVGSGATGIASAYNTYNGQIAAAAYCGEVKSTSKNLKTGCSVVRTVEWTPENVDRINTFCSGGIEGNL